MAHCFTSLCMATHAVVILFACMQVALGDKNASHTTHMRRASDSAVHGEEAAKRYSPIWKFDSKADENCFPDIPSSARDGTCSSTWIGTPTYYEEHTCGSFIVFSYWLWYGWQNACFADHGAHGNDWEHISVYVGLDGQVAKVMFFQHSGHYTRRAGTFESEYGHPVVYVGKNAHGSYHAGCDGTCSFSEFWSCGCALRCLSVCAGGCGWWDDYRNNNGGQVGRAWESLYPLQPGQTVDGIERRTSSCPSTSCTGARTKLAWDSSCWQDEP
uniref:Uncharacterized protein n=1 Tax=Pyrodinium bahamense TaxID=73915 RepID=A0A7S0A6S7_9DINO